MTPVVLQIIVTIIGSGAIFSFIQFLIQRHDNKDNKIDSIVDNIKEGRNTQEKVSKERYDDLKQEIAAGLKKQQDWGFKHYDEHTETIRELKGAILQLTQNDTEMQKYMKNIGDALVGLSHDKILELSDKYLQRGAITLKEKSTIKSIYDPYRRLGGNGDCEVAYQYICELPIVSEEKAKEMDNNK